MTANTTIAASLRTFVADELLMGQGVDFDGDDRLIEDGIIDSLGLLEIVNYIESEFDVIVDDNDVVVEIFGTINAMAAYVESLGATV